MRSKNRHHLIHDSHIWIPFVDVLLIIVAGLILRDVATQMAGGKQASMYRSLEDVHLVQASSEGGFVPDAAEVIKLDSSGKVHLRGKSIEIAELARDLRTPAATSTYVVAVDDNARAGDAQRVELMLKDAKANYARLFRRQLTLKEGNP